MWTCTLQAIRVPSMRCPFPRQPATTMGEKPSKCGPFPHIFVDSACRNSETRHGTRFAQILCIAHPSHEVFMTTLDRPLHDLCAADLMSRDVVLIPDDMSLQDAARRLVRNQISG